ncbi:putative sulfite oxidase [Xylogone sp. PMI_703]|nr:putative sulfite oxidase [Xylogone sp. PMI_703]
MSRSSLSSCISKSSLTLTLARSRPSIASASSRTLRAAKETRWSPNPGKRWSSNTAPPHHHGGRRLITAFVGGTAATTILVGSQLDSSNSKNEGSTPFSSVESSPPGTRKIRLTEVKLHGADSPHPWVTHGTAVYDITDWVGAHPGGEVILRAAGGSLDPYWNIFSIHKKQDVYDILEQFKIGEIDELDLVDGKVPQEAIEDPFKNDPVRDSRLRTLTARPCNAETPASGLEPFLTPNNFFYVRNHMWVPDVPAAQHHLTIELPNGEEKSYTMEELQKRFHTHKITATLQCSGNRRNDMTVHARPTNGLQWTVGAISSAEWEGVLLRDVLADAGLNTQNLPANARHAQFSGLEAYGASIPITKAVDPSGDVLLAFRMNGEELPRDHGYPLRVIVPGNVAARSVKWLRKVVIADEESTSQWQRRDYKCFGPNVGANPDWSKAKSIQEMPVTSAITEISNASHSAQESDKQNQDVRPLTVSGYAYSGGGREIVRVDISTDGGETWDQAELLDDRTHGSKAWCWKRWRYSGPSLKNLNRDKTTLLVKATDESYNTQPKDHTSIYNARGNLATAWHRVDIGLKGGERERA